MNHCRYLQYLQQVKLYSLIFSVIFIRISIGEQKKNLHFNSIDIIPREPPWGESETCLECGVRFTITNRKHHWLVFDIF
jgi:hypothetical protein